MRDPMPYGTWLRMWVFAYSLAEIVSFTHACEILSQTRWHTLIGSSCPEPSGFPISYQPRIVSWRIKPETFELTELQPFPLLDMTNPPPHSICVLLMKWAVIRWFIPKRIKWNFFGQWGTPCQSFPLDYCHQWGKNGYKWEVLRIHCCSAIH